MISSHQLINYGGSWQARCDNSYNSQCWSSLTISNTYFYCTDYSESEDWTVGENNFTYTFNNSEKQWHMRNVFLHLYTVLTRRPICMREKHVLWGLDLETSQEARSCSRYKKRESFTNREQLSCYTLFTSWGEWFRRTKLFDYRPC